MRAGRLAAFVDADEVEVTLRLPPPLDRPLAVERDGDVVRLLDGDALVAEARPRRVDVEPPDPVSLEVAEEARAARPGLEPDFASASSAAMREDGLEIRVGPGRRPGAAPRVADRASRESAGARLGGDRLPRRVRGRCRGARRRSCSAA